jgi:hypothetical protein
MAAVDGGGAPVESAGSYSQAIDVGTLTADPKPNRISLPHGAVGNNYALTLNLTNCANDTDTFSWKLTPGSGSNDATSRAAIALSGKTNQTVLFSFANVNKDDLSKQLLVTLQLTNNSATPPVTYTLQFDIVVLQCDAITLAPPVLMPVTVGTAYSQNLVAHHANGKFAWSVTFSLPPGLTWDDGSHQLSGTVTDAAQIGKAFSLVVGLTAPDVIMDPLAASLGVTVQSAPAVASDVPLWERILLYAAGPSLVAMTAIIAFAISRYKKGKANTKTGDAAGEGNKKITDATGDNPKSVTKSIAEAERATIPIIERNIPDTQGLISAIAERQASLSVELAKSEEIVSKLTEYYVDHENDDPNEPVSDPELVQEGYRTLGDVTKDLPNLSLENENLRSQLSTTTEQLNSVTAANEEYKNRVVASNDGELNNESLLRE